MSFRAYLISQEIEFGEISKEALLEKSHPIDSTANAAYLYKYRRTYFTHDNRGGFSLVSEIHNRIKIYNKEGLNWGNFKILLYKQAGIKERISGIRGYTFNESNNKIKKTKLKRVNRFTEEVNDNVIAQKIAFADIKEGSIIDFKYVVNSPFVSKIDDIIFQYNIPVNKLDITIETPEYFIFKKRSKGYYSITPTERKKQEIYNIRLKSKAGGSFLTPMQTTTDSKIIYTKKIEQYKAKNIVAIADSEPYISNINNYRGGVKYELSYIKYPNSNPKFYTTTWEDISKKINLIDDFGGELKRNRYFKDDLPSILADAKTDIEKTISIFNFIKNKITWNKKSGKFTDKGVKKAYKTGSGNTADINLALTAMLRKAGLKANPVLVSTRDHEIPLFPTLNGFNYVISIVEFKNGGTVLLDATEPYSLPNILPARTINWSGRKIMENGKSEWISLTPRKVSSENSLVKLKIDTDGTATGFTRLKYDRLFALTKRKEYNNTSEEDILSELEEEYEIEIDDHKILNQNSLGKPLSEMFKFSTDNLVEEINDKLYINPLLFLTDKENPFKLDDRKFPIDFATPWKETSSISIEIPEGYEVSSIPEQMAIGISDNIGFFKFKPVNKGTSIQINAVLEFDKAMIPPSFYQEVKAFYTQVIAKQNEKIVLSKIQ